MEILILGVILVAIMVWASTRIKRNAAAAFEAETVETDDFVINKPEGFLHVLNDDSGMLFRSYSKEFGKVGRQDVRQATIVIERHRGTSIDKVIDSIRAGAESFEPGPAHMVDGRKARSARSVVVRDGGEYDAAHELFARGADVIEARGEVLAEHKDAYLGRIEAAMETLKIK